MKNSESKQSRSTTWIVLIVLLLVVITVSISIISVIANADETEKPYIDNEILNDDNVINNEDPIIEDDIIPDDALIDDEIFVNDDVDAEDVVFDDKIENNDAIIDKDEIVVEDNEDIIIDNNIFIPEIEDVVIDGESDKTVETVEPDLGFNPDVVYNVTFYVDGYGFFIIKLNPKMTASNKTIMMFLLANDEFSLKIHDGYVTIDGLSSDIIIDGFYVRDGNSIVGQIRLGFANFEKLLSGADTVSVTTAIKY
jgi:hypothetical protein